MTERTAQNRSFLSGIPGEMTGRFMSHDWSATPLGPAESWPQSLRTAVQLMLASRQPAYVAWGKELTSLYNDGYIPMLGTRHPEALGKPMFEVWSEITEDLELLVSAILKGEAQFYCDYPVALAGRPERPLRWFTFSWTPLRDDAGDIAGFYCVATETTEQVLARRRQDETEAALRDSEARLATAIEAVDAGIYEHAIPMGRELYYNPRWAAILGYAPDELPAHEDFQDWLYELVHPDDREELTRAYSDFVAGRTEKYRVTIKLRHKNDQWIWVEALGNARERDQLGRATQVVGVIRDVTERVRADEHQKLLMAELDHRVRNILAVVHSIAQQSLRGAEKSVTESFVGRLSALAKSHTLLAEGRWHGASIKQLASDAVSPYQRSDESQFSFIGPDIHVTAKAAQSLMLVFHELVTNAVKYGALSRPKGQVSVQWKVRDKGSGRHLAIVWRETGGPRIESPPRHKGFGSSLIRLTMAYELGGEAHLSYRPSGLVASLSLSPETPTDAQAQEDGVTHSANFSKLEADDIAKN